MPAAPVILAIESSCDETAAAICDGHGTILASVISTQIAAHQPYGGVVPELASRNHMTRLQPVVAATLAEANLDLSAIDGFAATSGPGLASSLLVGSTAAKAMALACNRPFLAINHLEGHLLSPFIGLPDGIQPGIALIVSGGHTLLLLLNKDGSSRLLGTTRDDAAGEAFDKAGKMLGLPYPGGPAIEKTARSGNPKAYAFPRSMLDSGDYAFSFSGLKTSLLYLLPQLGDSLRDRLPDLCASFQEAIVDVLVTKSLRAAREFNAPSISLSGGVSCNRRLREAFTDRAHRARRSFIPATGSHTTDNAAMIAFAALQRFRRGESSPLDADIDPNLKLASA
ncbi:MAG: N6-L-threonylcarbamoyladenine synthase [Verrucomicrobia bacterium]|jgi:N6-L-threonylcarbamoyladenine synthase|nr:MAG: N6-L-threonylcarbamoyladenine synthase [Verrucomicrobiota bacterium]